MVFWIHSKCIVSKNTINQCSFFPTIQIHVECFGISSAREGPKPIIWKDNKTIWLYQFYPRHSQAPCEIHKVCNSAFLYGFWIHSWFPINSYSLCHLECSSFALNMYGTQRVIPNSTIIVHHLLYTRSVYTIYLGTIPSHNSTLYNTQWL